MSRTVLTIVVVILAAGAGAQEVCFEPDGHLDLVVHLPNQAEVWSVEIDQDWAFVLRKAPSEPPELQVYTFHDPEALVLVATLALPVAESGKLIVAGGRAYVALLDVDPGPLLIIDIADPTAPQLLSTTPIDQGIIDMDVEGTMVALTSPYYGLILLEAFDAINPQWLSFIWGYGNVQKVDLLADRAVCTTEYTFALLVFSLVDPTNPTLELAQHGPRMYDLVMDADGLHGWGTSLGNLVWIDLEGEDRHIHAVDRHGGRSIVRIDDVLVTYGALMRFFAITGTGSAELRYRASVAVADVAFKGDDFLAALGNNGLAVYDVAIHGTSPVAAVEPGVYVEPGHRLVPIPDRDHVLELDPYRDRVQLLDGSDPPRIQRRGTWDHPGDPRSAVVQGDLALIAHDAGVQLLDIGDPDQLVDLGTVLPYGGAYGFLWEGDRLWVGSMYSDLWLFDMTDPTAPVELLHQIWVGSIRALVRYGDYLVLGAYLSGVYVLDVTDPLVPVLAGQVTGVLAGTMALSGHRLYVGATIDDRVSVISLEDPAAPVILGGMSPDSSGIWGIARHDDALWITSRFRLYAYDAADPDTDPTPLFSQTDYGSYSLAPVGRFMAVGSSFTAYVYLMNPPCLTTTEVGNLAPVTRPALRLTASPNPFNPMTTIEFMIATEGRVRLRVYDLRGRLVAILVDEVLPSGRHEVEWNGRDTDGREVASGGYLSRLETRGQIVHGGMTLVR